MLHTYMIIHILTVIFRGKDEEIYNFINLIFLMQLTYNDRRSLYVGCLSI